MNISKPYSKNDSTLSIFANIAEERLNPATRTATIDEKTPKIVMYSVLCLLKSSLRDFIRSSTLPTADFCFLRCSLLASVLVTNS